MPEAYDMVVIGGGINGTGIAADAAGRGLSVFLCEQHDLASATSSASSKLVHGGLRYLEQLQFRLVKEALNEREILLRKAPHLVTPLRFVLPHNKALRSEWLIRLGLFLYDHLAKHILLPDSSIVNFTSDISGKSLNKAYPKGFAYSDGFVDDSRLVVANALAAKQFNATIATRTCCVDAKRSASHWELTLHDTISNSKRQINAKTLVNATGPWVLDVLNKFHITSNYEITLIKGSHIVLPKFYQGEHAYILQNNDKRIIFVIPYLKKFCLIGTTDIFFSGDPINVAIADDEINYLCNAVQAYFTVPINKHEIVHTYSGVRPLSDNRYTKAAELSRDYELELNSDAAPLLSVFGGKLTTHRKLAEKAVDLIAKYFPNLTRTAWTENSILPGGDLRMSFADYLMTQEANYPWLPKDLLHRYVAQFGSLLPEVLKDAHEISALGKHYGAQLYQKEVEYLIKNEWAYTSEDILWRRTKLGYFFPEKCISLLDDDLKKYV